MTRSLSCVLSSSVFSFHAFSGLIVVSSPVKMVKDGVFIFEDALISSSNLGTPRVTFLAELPALWKVLSVLWTKQPFPSMKDCNFSFTVKSYTNSSVSYCSIVSILSHHTSALTACFSSDNTVDGTLFCFAWPINVCNI